MVGGMSQSLTHLSFRLPRRAAAVRVCVVPAGSWSVTVEHISVQLRGYCTLIGEQHHTTTLLHVVLAASFPLLVFVLYQGACYLLRGKFRVGVPRKK